MILGNQMHLDTRWMVIRSAGHVIVINLAPNNSDNPPFLAMIFLHVPVIVPVKT